MISGQSSEKPHISEQFHKEFEKSFACTKIVISTENWTATFLIQKYLRGSWSHLFLQPLSILIPFLRLTSLKVLKISTFYQVI